MPTTFGQTGFYHDDYKVQREFERINRKISEANTTASQEQIITNTPVGDDVVAEPVESVQWALTLLKNNIPINDVKVVQAINYLRDYIEYIEPTQDIRIPIEFSVQKVFIDSNLATVDNAVQMNIIANAITQLLDWVMLIPYGQHSIQLMNEYDQNDNTVYINTGIFRNMKRKYYTLVNDEEFPGENYVYGTGNYGLKGWYPLPEGDKTATFQFITPAYVWEIAHDLGKYPSVTCEDLDGVDIEGTVEHINTSLCKVHWASLESGIAYLN